MESCVICLIGVAAECELSVHDASDEIDFSGDGINIKWSVSQLTSSIDVLLSSTNLNIGTAWFAFGLSESGGMVGSDIVTVEFSTDTGSVSSSGVLVDRHVPWSAAPLEASPLPFPVTDTVQDWELVCSQNSANSTTALMRRLLVTGDEQDRPFLPGPTSVIYAWGTGALGYHGSSRGSAIVDFLGEEEVGFVPPADADASSVLGFSPGHALNAVTTQYICQVHDMGTSLRHVVAVEQVYSSSPMASYVHHVLVHACGNSMADLTAMNLRADQPSPCQKTDQNAKGTSPSGTGACTSLLYGGAVGGGAFVLPEEAGMLLGEDVRYIVVEAHIDNPEHHTGNSVTEIVRIHTTSALRPMNAGSMVIGDPAIFLTSIPADAASAHFETTCPAECTASFASDRHVFSSFLHMHQVGRSIWTSLLKRDSHDQLVSKHTYDYREFWNFGFQQLTPVNLTLSPGDQINTHCVYDTTKTGKSSGVQFGSSSTQEMCMSFLFYYPYLRTDGYFCGYMAPMASLCGSSGAGNLAVLAGPNPVPDGDTSLPEDLLVFYEGGGGGGGDENADGDGDGDGGEALTPGEVAIAVTVAALVVIAAVVGGVIFQRRRAGGGGGGGGASGREEDAVDGAGSHGSQCEESDDGLLEGIVLHERSPNQSVLGGVTH